MTKTFRAAAVQMRSGTVPEENAARLEELVREAAAQGASYIQTPEMTGMVQRKREGLEKMLGTAKNDIVVSTAGRLAADLRVTLHIGSTPVRSENGGIANRAFIFAPDGSLIVSYDKIHMYDADLPNGERWRESAIYSPGSTAIVADIPAGRIGVAICYDLRFPALFRDQALSGAHVLTVPSAFTRQTGEAHWHVLLRARAIENGAWVIAAAQGGKHEDGRETYGHSVVIDPWGTIVAEADHDRPAVVVADIDLTASADARQRIPNLKNAREYSLRVIGEEGAERRVS